MKKFRQVVKESIIDPVRPTLSPQVFDHPESENASLKPHVQEFIRHRILDLFQDMEIRHYALIGSILTHRWTETSDIDLNVRVDASYKNIKELRKIAVKKSGHLLPNTLHPVNFHLVFDDEEYQHKLKVADGVYDVVSNVWLRKPDESRPFDVSEYFGMFKKKVAEFNALKSELKHDLIDYTALKNLPRESLSKLRKLIAQQLKEVEKDALNLSDYYDKIKQDRRDAFDKPITRDEIRKYGSKNRLPENVIFKLMEKYHYLEFLKKVDEIIGSDRKLSKDEADELADYVLKKS